MTRAPYASASVRTCRAPATEPRIDAWSPDTGIALPATNAEPLVENWMITGLLSLAAVSITAFIEFDPMQLAAGIANCSAFANANSWATESPVRTPAGKSFRRSVTFASVEVLPPEGPKRPERGRARAPPVRFGNGTESGKRHGTSRVDRAGGWHRDDHARLAAEPQRAVAPARRRAARGDRRCRGARRQGHRAHPPRPGVLRRRRPQGALRRARRLPPVRRARSNV